MTVPLDDKFSSGDVPFRMGIRIVSETDTIALVDFCLTIIASYCPKRSGHLVHDACFRVVSTVADHEVPHRRVASGRDVQLRDGVVTRAYITENELMGWRYERGPALEVHCTKICRNSTVRDKAILKTRNSGRLAYRHRACRGGRNDLVLEHKAVVYLQSDICIKRHRTRERPVVPVGAVTPTSSTADAVIDCSNGVERGKE